jgi:hypothetical protein
LEDIMLEEKEDLPDQVLKAVRYLADRCDGAKRRDHRGFNKKDSSFGKSLAQQQVFSLRQIVAAAQLVARYPSQLARGGLRAPTESELAVYIEAHGDGLGRRT